LTCDALNADGTVLYSGLSRSPIPFVLVPGDSHYMALEVPAKIKKSGGAFLEIGMMQEGVRQRGNTLRVKI
jgi:hypothetical protein